jgi:hypothetical protein
LKDAEKRTLKKRLAWSAAVVAALTVGYRFYDPLPPVSEPRFEPLPHPNAYDTYLRTVEAIADRDAMPSFDTLTAPGYRDVETAIQRGVPANEEALGLAREALAQPFVLPLRLDPSRPYDVHEAQKLYDVARLFQTEARYFRINGQAGRAMSSILDGLAFGAQVKSKGILANRVLGTWIDAIMRSGSRRLVYELSAQEAAEAARRLEQILARSEPFRTACERQREFDIWAAYELAQETSWKLYFDRGRAKDSQGEEWKITKEPPAGSRRSIVERVRRDWDAWMTLLDRRFADAYPLPPAPSSNFTDRTVGIEESAWFSDLQGEARNRCFLTALALRAFLADHGQYPESLKALVPTYLKEVPLDPFGFRPLRYRPYGATYELYSVGPDGKDDGGRAVANSGGYRVRIGDLGDLTYPGSR